MGTDNEIIFNEEEMVGEENEDMQIDNEIVIDKVDANNVEKIVNKFQKMNCNTLDKFLEKIDNANDDDDDDSSLHEELDVLFQKKSISLKTYIRLKFVLFFREKHTAKALELLERYKDDLKDRYHALRAKIYIEEKKYKEGIDYINDILDKSKNIPSDSEEYSKIIGYKIECLYYLGEYKEVMSLYEDEVENKDLPNFRLQFLYCHLYYLSCIMADNDEKKKAALEEIHLLNDSEFKKNLCRDYWFYDVYKEETKSFDWETVNKSLNHITKYEFLYYMIKYSEKLNFAPDVLIGVENMSKLSNKDLYFKNLMSSVHDSDKMTLERYNRIWFWTQIILIMLMIKDDDKVDRFSYYTSKETALNLINGKYHIAKMSLSNVNDKIEGAVLPIIFQKNGINFNIDCKENDYVAVQTSFTRKEDDLTMFRLYGKENGEEATGISFVFNKTFFNTNLAAIEGNICGLGNAETKPFSANREPLIWILYYDEAKNRLFYFPDKEELEAYIIDLNDNKNENGNKKDDWNEYKDSEKKEQTQNRLRYSFKKLFDAINELKTDEEKKIAMKILYQLRYCIKSSDFADEKECRILEVCNPFDDDIEEDSNKVLYKNYLQINNNKNFLEKIIVGPKVSKPNVIKEYVQRNMQKTKIEVTVSNAPLD
ncbi:MAG: hypothetical protein IKQ61_07365 [Spirochaetales bacterium]|nr:hypothetical protein [Spirochaetales bacterium]